MTLRDLAQFALHVMKSAAVPYATPGRQSDPLQTYQFVDTVRATRSVNETPLRLQST